MGKNGDLGFLPTKALKIESRDLENDQDETFMELSSLILGLGLAGLNCEDFLTFHHSLLNRSFLPSSPLTPAQVPACPWFGAHKAKLSLSSGKTKSPSLEKAYYKIGLGICQE